MVSYFYNVLQTFFTFVTLQSHLEMCLTLFTMPAFTVRSECTMMFFCLSVCLFCHYIECFGKCPSSIYLCIWYVFIFRYSYYFLKWEFTLIVIVCTAKLSSIKDTHTCKKTKNKKTLERGL